jgi:hypothetical protein
MRGIAMAIIGFTMVYTLNLMTARKGSSHAGEAFVLSAWFIATLAVIAWGV